MSPFSYGSFSPLFTLPFPPFHKTNLGKLRGHSVEFAVRPVNGGVKQWTSHASVETQDRSASRSPSLCFMSSESLSSLIRPSSILRASTFPRRPRSLWIMDVNRVPFSAPYHPFLALLPLPLPPIVALACRYPYSAFNTTRDSLLRSVTFAFLLHFLANLSRPQSRYSKTPAGLAFSGQPLLVNVSWDTTVTAHFLRPPFLLPFGFWPFSSPFPRWLTVLPLIGKHHSPPLFLFFVLI